MKSNSNSIALVSSFRIRAKKSSRPTKPSGFDFESYAPKEDVEYLKPRAVPRQVFVPVPCVQLAKVMHNPL